MLSAEPFKDLVFVYMPGCEACEEAMPELDKFSVKNPRFMILKIRADGPLVQILIGRRIRATPTYVLRSGGQGMVHEGGLSAEEIETWIAKGAES